MTYKVVVTNIRPSADTPFFDTYLSKQPPSDLQAAQNRITANSRAAGSTLSDTHSQDKLRAVRTITWPDQATYEKFQRDNAADLAVQSAALVAYNSSKKILRTVTKG